MKIKTSPSSPTPLSSSLAGALGVRLFLEFALLSATAHATTTQGSFDKYHTLNDGVLKYEENAVGTGLTVDGSYNWPTGEVQNLEIPDSVVVNGVSRKVTAVGANAFDVAQHGNSLITGTLTIPDSIVSIGCTAFRENCMTHAILPETVARIGFSAFSDCTYLQAANIPKSVTILEENTFWGCSSLASVNFSEGLTSIGWDAFRNCQNLTSVSLPESLKIIGGNSFASCSSLKTLVIPSGVSLIGDSAFGNCSSLDTVVLSKNVGSIGRGAFNPCVKLKAVTFYGGMPSMLLNFQVGQPFSNSPSKQKITIHCYPGVGFEEAFTDTDQFTIKYIAPDIAVFSSSGTDLRNNSLRNFGRIQTRKASPSVTFRIQNTGSLPLNDIKIGTSGANRLDFKIVSPPARTLAAGAITTFKVKFSPGAKGERGTILKIESNDPDEQIFKIKLTGRGF